MRIGFFFKQKNSFLHFLVLKSAKRETKAINVLLFRIVYLSPFFMIVRNYVFFKKIKKEKRLKSLKSL